MVSWVATVCEFHRIFYYEANEFLQNDAVVAGGGAIEMELSRHLREYSRTIAGKEQLLIAAMAKAFEIIPMQLCENAGFDPTIILNKLRQKHSLGKEKAIFSFYNQ